MAKEPKPKLADCCDVCISRTSSPEWVGVLASEKGQYAVQALFPTFPIVWPPMPELAPDFAPGWSATELDLQKIMDACPGHKLVKVKVDPHETYVYRLGASLHVNGIRVIYYDGDRYKGFESGEGLFH